MLAITKYAQRLIDDLDDVDYIGALRFQQRNWITTVTPALRSISKTTDGDTLTSNT